VLLIYVTQAALMGLVGALIGAAIGVAIQLSLPSALKDYLPLGLPAVEVYHAARINVRFALNHTDLCLPMRRKSVA